MDIEDEIVDLGMRIVKKAPGAKDLADELNLKSEEPDNDEVNEDEVVDLGIRLSGDSEDQGD